MGKAEKRSSSLVIWSFLFVLYFSGSAFGQTKNQALFDTAVDYINCRLAQLSIEEQDNGKAPHIKAFAESFQCDKSLNNPELIKFLGSKNLALSVKLNQSVNDFKSKFSPSLNKEQLISLLEDDLLEVRLESFASNHVDSYAKLRTELSSYIDKDFKKFDKSLLEKDVSDDETPVFKEDVIPEKVTPARKIDTPASETEKTNRGIGFLVWMLIGAFIGALAYNMFLRYGRRNPAVSPQSHNMTALRNKNNTLQNELDNLREQNANLHSEISELQNKLFLLGEQLLDEDLTDLKTGLEEEE